MKVRGNSDGTWREKMSTSYGPDTNYTKKTIVYSTDLPFLCFLLGREAQGRHEEAASENSSELRHSCESQGVDCAGL